MVCQSYKKLNKIFDYLHKFFVEGGIISNETFKDEFCMYIGENPSNYARTGDDKKNDLSNVSESWSKLKFLAYTSTICIGVDYSVLNHFNSVVGVYSGEQGLNADLFVQGLLWVRNPSCKTHMLFMRGANNILSDSKQITPVKCHKELRKTLTPNNLLIDGIAHSFNGLKYTLMSRLNLIHKYAQDWILNSLSSIGFQFKYVSQDDFLDKYKNTQDTSDISPHHFKSESVTLTDIIKVQYKTLQKWNLDIEDFENEDFNKNIITKFIKELWEICEKERDESLRNSSLKELDEIDISNINESNMSSQKQGYIFKLIFNKHFSPTNLKIFSSSIDQPKYIKDIEKYSLPAAIELLRGNSYSEDCFKEQKYPICCFDDVCEYMSSDWENFISHLISNFNRLIVVQNDSVKNSETGSYDLKSYEKMFRILLICAILLDPSKAVHAWKID